jgi:endonuclease III
MGTKNISVVIEELSKYYNFSERTTLNRMRKQPDPFKILISCLLSLRARDENTEVVSKKLFSVADTPEKILEISTERLEELIFSSGHYRKKARTIKHVSEVLITDFKSTVPKKKEELLSIKGIGPKTANIVLAFAFGENVIPVDVHVHVIANRLGWVNTKHPENTEKQLYEVLPKKYWKELNALFVMFGKEVCITISPKCSSCPIRKVCPRIGVVRSR